MIYTNAAVTFLSLRIAFVSWQVSLRERPKGNSFCFYFYDFEEMKCWNKMHISFSVEMHFQFSAGWYTWWEDKEARVKIIYFLHSLNFWGEKDAFAKDTLLFFEKHIL